MATVTVEIPDDVLAKLTRSGGDINKALRLAAAFSLCSRGELSTSQAARLAGMAYARFLETAAEAKVELYPVRLDELREEADRGFTLGGQRVADHPAGQGGAGRPDSTDRRGVRPW